MKVLRFFSGPQAAARVFRAMLVALLWWGSAPAVSADRYVVVPGTPGGTNAGPYTNWGIAATQIQWAVDAAAAGETVWLSNGLYCLTNQVTITNNIILRGLNGWSNTLVYADWPAWTTRCFYVSGTGALHGLTVSNGHFFANVGTNGGGGAWLDAGTIQNCYFVNNVCSNGITLYGGGGVYVNGAGTVADCVFFSNTVHRASAGNEATFGGAICIKFGSVLNCTLTRNQILPEAAGRGGGIGIMQGGSALISNCVFDANIGFYGSGIFMGSGCYMTDCVLTNHGLSGWYVVECRSSMRNCLIARNATRALFITGSATNCVIAGNRFLYDACVFFDPYTLNDITMERCTFSNNLSAGGAGGGAISMTNRGVLRNCLIHHNTNTSAGGYGGGVLLGNAVKDPGKHGVLNCTIVDNYSQNEGGGVCLLGPSNYLANCVIAGNRSALGNYPNAYYKDNPGANMSNFHYCCVITSGTYLAQNQGNITNDPAFAGAGDWRLSPNSPCINTGTNMSWMTNAFDLDGKTRLRYGIVDMGAYERIYEGSIYRLQ